jgi:hypothetical protein
MRDNGIKPVFVLDSLGEAFSLDGINENIDAEVAPWLRRVIRRIVGTGATVIVIDHTINNAEGDNALRPSGSKRKRAAITGSLYRVDATIPLNKGEGGELKLTCAKDRHGNYRRGETVATIVVSSMRAVGMPSMTYRVHAPAYPGGDASQAQGELVALDALRSIQVPGGISATVWRSAIPEIADRTFYKYRAALVASGEVVNVGSDRAPRYCTAPVQLSTARSTARADADDD